MTDVNDLTQLTDEALLQLVIRRSERALGALYDRYGRVSYAIALRVTGDRQTAEEVVQDVFQQIWQTASGFRAESGAAGTWLMSIARHRAIDATRSKRERARTRESMLEESRIDERRDGPEAEVVRRSTGEDIRSALATLPPAQRQAIDMAYFGGLSRPEIAQALGEPVGTIKARLRLGLTKLRDALAHYDETESI